MNYTKKFKQVCVVAASILAIGMLSGCDKSTKEATEAFAMSKGMEDCKVYYMSSTNGNNIIVVRCPNSSTTTRSGKNTNATVVDNAATESVEKDAEVKAGKNNDEVQINGETYRKSETMKEVEINGETYKKVQ